MHTEVSVIIPTYRRPAFLRTALESVCKAAKNARLDSRTLEIVVVDDGHCSKSREICEVAKSIHPYSIMYRRTEPRPGGGAAKARNQGILSAGGDYIFLLDDDDQFQINRFHSCLPLLRSGHFDAVLERTLRVCVDGRNPPYITGPVDKIIVDPLTYLIAGGEDSHVTPGATSFTKNIFVKSGGFDEALQLGEDAEFLLRLCAVGRVVLRADEPVALSTFHEHNRSRPDQLRYWQNIKTLRHLYDNLERIGALNEAALVKRHISAKLDYVLTRIRLEEPRYIERLKSGILALFHYPVTCLTLNNLKTTWVFFARVSPGSELSHLHRR